MSGWRCLWCPNQGKACGIAGTTESLLLIEYGGLLITNGQQLMYPTLYQIIARLQYQHVSKQRCHVLQPLIDYIREKMASLEEININFICTHNSRRSHLSQVWAQVAAAYFGIPRVHCYSGGTEKTALFPVVADTLIGQGFLIFKIAGGSNPVYAIKYSENALPIIGFSKTYDNPFNPVSAFAAVMTCSQADGGCPFISGAERRIPITFEDPKISDHTPEQTEVYAKRSLQIAEEMFYVFSMINK